MPATSDNSVLTSTKNQEATTTTPVINRRREAIIPTPNRPTIRNNSFVMNRESDSSLTDQIDKRNSSDTNSDGVVKSNPIIDDQYLESSLHRKYPAARASAVVSSAIDDAQEHTQTCIFDNQFEEQGPLSTTVIATHNPIDNFHISHDFEIQSQSDEDKNDHNFDTFIVNNFVPFSGKQNVILWLDQTESKFKELRMARHLRFKAISLLIEGVAKRKYLAHRKEIKSFDDFYEFLLSQFDMSNLDTDHSNCNHRTANQLSNPSTPFKPRPIDNSTSTVIHLTDNTMLTRQTPAFCSTAIVDVGATNPLGETHATTSVNSSNNLSASDCDRTLIDLRKAIVADLIRNPKIFNGVKDDVKKWIEDVEHLLEVAHIPEPTRLDLISYSLRNDALEWYKNNKSNLTSWHIFVTEIKRAFTSSFHEEMAFKLLESYTQGENQSIRNFFNEILKLCREADSTMSEATKLKNLVNKTRPIIQFEVRKKKPKTTIEFLEYAKEAEELIQLSNLTIEDNLTPDVHTSNSSYVVPLLPDSSAQTNQSFGNRPNNYSSNYSRNDNRDYRPSHNRNVYPNSKTSFDNSTSLPGPQSNQNKPRYNQANFQPNQNKFTSNSRNYNQKKQSQFSNSSSQNNYPSQTSANTVNPSYQPSPTNQSQEIFSSILCTRCNQLGHEATACSSF